jgi:phospholipid/cholesterol/gamma-HCH transport system ATP-binding protein
MKSINYKIEIYGLKKKFGDKVVFDGLDLKIIEGETFVLIGQSGVGKSVLLKHITGLIFPDEGEIYIDGEEIHSVSENRHLEIQNEIGMLFQGGALFDSFTVGQNLLFALDHMRPELDDKEKEIRILTSLEMVDLAGIEDVMPSELSGGMMKRVALARAIVSEPALVLFDEPTTGLDPIMTANINELIASVKKNLKTTFIVVTHDISSARCVADRIGMLYNGKMIFTGSKRDLDKSDNAYLQQFIDGSTHGPILTEYKDAIKKMKEKLR